MRILIGAVAVLVGTVGATSAWAQFVPGEAGMSGVVGTGSVTLEREPNVMRLQLMVEAEGKDVKEALAKLKEKEAADREQLQKLGAARESVKFSDAQPEEINSQQQMQRMIQMRMGNAPKPAKNQPVVVTLSTTLKAEWPLTGKDGDELLVEAQDLEDKIKAADLPVKKAGKPLTPEQEEVAEENQGMNNNNDGQPNPRDPAFTFVCKISDEDRAAARAEAYKKARDDAQRLAKAANVELGSIRFIGGSAAPAPAGDRMDTYAAAFQQQAMFNVMTQQQGADEVQEAVGPQPGKVGYRITVNVSFAPKE